AAGVCLLAVSAAGTARAAGLTDLKLPGELTAVSCLSASECVTVGATYAGSGEIVAVHDGTRASVSLPRGTRQFIAVSCPSAAGCWALGQPTRGSSLVLAQISETGRVARTASVAVAKHVTLSAISCVSMRACELAGEQFNAGKPFRMEAGSWNGRRLTLHSGPRPRAASQAMIEQVSCYRGSCVAVGLALYGSEVERGLVMTISNGRPVRVRTFASDLFASVSCVSTTTCYAAGGFSSGPGFVVTLRDGVPGAGSRTTSDLTGIACTGRKCTAAGALVTSNADVGILAPVSAGRLSTIVADLKVAGYSGVSTRGHFGGFAAIGAGPRTGSVLTTD
ncbi:MAG TPA: hypothetical protein VK823_05955, partial [Streptosporangiaceae bacterium]|nr:hypothetical protein [Streptosporangiaceae bacterium]